MNNIISVDDFTRKTNNNFGIESRYYLDILVKLEKYHSDNNRNNQKEFFLLQKLHIATCDYLTYKKSSYYQPVRQLIENIETRMKLLEEQIPLIAWPSFDSAVISSNPPGNKSNYDHQVIVQLQDNNIVHNAVERLAKKNPEKTLIVQYDAKKGTYRPVYGVAEQFNGDNVRWVLVGHGSAADGLMNQRMAGLTPDALYAGIKELRIKMALRSPQRIVLLGCRLGNNIGQQGFHENFAQNFITQMYTDNKNSLTSVRAYSSPVMVSDEGQRTTISHPTTESTIHWLQETKHRADFHWSHGLLKSNNIPVILLVINDIYLKKISAEYAIQHHKAILAWCFDNGHGAISWDLLNKTVNNGARRDQFISLVIQANQIPENQQGIREVKRLLDVFKSSKEPRTDSKIMLHDQLDAPLSTTPPLSGIPFNAWGEIQPKKIIPVNYENTLNYDYQVIIQLEEDTQIRQSVEKLAARHPDNSLVIQYKVATGESRLIYGDPAILKSGDDSRWFLVGHSRNDPQGVYPTLGGATVEQLSSGLKTLSAKHVLKPPARIVLAAHSSDNFGMRLISFMHDNFPATSVRAYNSAETLNIAGRSVTFGDDTEGKTLWLAKNSHLHVDYQRKVDNRIIANGIPAAFLVMDDIYSGRLSLHKAITDYTDILKSYFHTADNKFDKELLTTTVNNPEQFEKFVSYAELILKVPTDKIENFGAWLKAQTVLPPEAASDKRDIRLETLKTRGNKVLAITSQLATGTIKFADLNHYELRYLNDFFQRPDGALDTQRLMLTLADKLSYQTFYSELQNLLQLGHGQRQLQGFSGQQALQYSKNWNHSLSENIISLQQAADKNKILNITAAQINIALNTLYIGDDSHKAKRSVSDIGFAWLHALSRGESSRDHFLNGLNTYTEINELQATASLAASEAQPSSHFRRLLDELNSHNYLDKRYFTALGNYTLDAGLPLLNNNQENSYFQLVADNHVLALAKRIVNGQLTLYLYNSDIGEIRLAGQSPAKTIQSLNILLSDYLNGKSQAWGNQTLADHYGVQTVKNSFSFSVYQMNTATVSNIPALKQLQQLLADGFGHITADKLAIQEDLYSTAVTFNFPENPQPRGGNKKKSGVPLSLNNMLFHVYNNRWQMMNQTTRGVGQVTQAYGYYQTLLTLCSYWEQSHNPKATAEEIQELEIEVGITLGMVALDISEYGLHKLGNYIAQKTLNSAAGGLVTAGSRLRRLGYATGIKLAKFSGPVLNFASCGFDIYNTWRDFSQLALTTSPRLRRDLIVNGSLSVLSAAVSISTSLAMMAGSIAIKFGAAIGVFTGLSIILTSRIYAAASQIADIKAYITLSANEELRNGLRLFIGQSIETEVQNRLTEVTSHEQARDNYNQLLKEQAETLLADVLFNDGIDTYIYSTGTFDLERQNCKKISGKKFGPKIDRIFGNFRQGYYTRIMVQDLIPPQNAAATLSKYEAIMVGEQHQYSELSIEDSEYYCYTPTDLRAVDDDVNADLDRFGGGAAKAIFQPKQVQDKPNGRQQTEAVDQAEIKTVKASAVLFDLRDEDDVAIGYLQKNNIFMVHAGHKQFIGGQLTDTFLLMGQPAPSNASKLDGGYPSSGVTTELSGDNDIVVASAAPADGVGYSIDLAKGEVRYLSETNPLVTRLDHIEHAHGHAGTNDILTGNEHNNALNGAGGLDKLYGNAGDDVLTLADGYAEGGSGIDTYCILQNVQAQHASIRIKDTASKTEINNIRLHYSAEQISSIELLPDDSVMLTLNNDNGTLTALTLTNIYRSADTSNQLKRINEYILYTLDGMVLFPQWPQTITQDEQGKWPFSPTLIGQYNPLQDQQWQEKFGDKKPEQVLVQLQRQDSSGRGRITVGDTQMVLPSLIQLATDGTSLNDQLEGDQQSNWLRGYQGNDCLIGKGGSDIYEIYENGGQDKQRYKVTIDNYDDYPSAVNQGEIQQPDIDFLLVKHSVNEIALKPEADDLVLCARNPDSGLPEIRIRNFMSDERNRHLMLIDKNGDSYRLELNELKQPYLKDDVPQAEPGQGNDYIVLSALAKATVNALAGDDVIVDKTGIGHTLKGGPGDDIIIVTAGNNLLYGEEGDDQLYGGAEPETLNGGSGNDTLSGGRGNDILMDFQGDDVYLFSLGDGEDIIRDVYGTNRLHFLGDEIDKNSLWFKRQGDHLSVLVGAQDSGDSIRLEGYFSKSQDKASNIIEVAGYQLRGADITALTQVMSNFPGPEFNRTTTDPANLIQGGINKFWSAVTE